jgi:hypothetical protein
MLDARAVAEAHFEIDAKKAVRAGAGKWSKSGQRIW